MKGSAFLIAGITCVAAIVTCVTLCNHTFKEIDRLVLSDLDE